jgi:hypothetical protein
MYITKSEELHMELEAAKAEGKAAIRDPEMSYHYTMAALTVWQDKLNEWENYNTRPKVTLQRVCLARDCDAEAKRWVAGNHETEVLEAFTSCWKHADAMCVVTGMHFLMRRNDFLNEVRWNAYYGMDFNQYGDEY